LRPAVFNTTLNLSAGPHPSGFLLGGRLHLPLEPPGLAPLVEGDYVDAQLLGVLRQALVMGRPHPPSHISLDGLAVGA